MTIPDFPTPEMLAAERAMDERIEVGVAAAREAEDLLARLAEEEANESAEAEPQEDAAALSGDQLRVLVTEHAMTPQWAAVVQQIAAGGLTWDQVAASLRSGEGSELVTEAARSWSSLPVEAWEAMNQLTEEWAASAASEPTTPDQTHDFDPPDSPLNENLGEAPATALGDLGGAPYQR